MRKISFGIGERFARKKASPKPIAKKPVSKVPIYTVVVPSLQDGEEGIRIKHQGHLIFEIDTTEFSHCCGAFEMGGIQIYPVEEDYSKKALENALDKALQDLFEINKNGTWKYSFVANLIDNKPCNILKKAFERTNLFSLERKWRNLNSGNEIEMWISNN